MGLDPMQDSFLALRDCCRDSGRDWFPILFFSAREYMLFVLWFLTDFPLK